MSRIGTKSDIVFEGKTIETYSAGILQCRFNVAAAVLDATWAKLVGPDGQLCMYLAILSADAKLSLLDTESNMFVVDLGLSCSRLIPTHVGVLIQGDTEKIDTSVTGGGMPCAVLRMLRVLLGHFSAQIQFFGSSMFLSPQLFASWHTSTFLQMELGLCRA